MEQLNFYPFTYEGGEKIVYKNRAITRRITKPSGDAAVDKLRMMIDHWCGYVCFKKTEIPKDWWGTYDGNGLQQLNIHGGITYCEQQGVPNQEQIEKKYYKKLEDLYKNHTPMKVEDILDIEDPLKAISKALEPLERRRKIMEEMNAELALSDEGYVVFGFDCGHHGDHDNPLLKDPNHIMVLAEQMMFQILLFRDKYEEFKNADEAVKNVVRKSIIENIRREADIQCEIGFGDILDRLSGRYED